MIVELEGFGDQFLFFFLIWVCVGVGWVGVGGCVCVVGGAVCVKCGAVCLKGSWVWVFRSGWARGMGRVNNNNSYYYLNRLLPTVTKENFGCLRCE